MTRGMQKRATAYHIHDRNKRYYSIPLDYEKPFVSYKYDTSKSRQKIEGRSLGDILEIESVPCKVQMCYDRSGHYFTTSDHRQNFHFGLMKVDDIYCENFLKGAHIHKGKHWVMDIYIIFKTLASQYLSILSGSLHGEVFAIPIASPATVVLAKGLHNDQSFSKWESLMNKLITQFSLMDYKGVVPSRGKSLHMSQFLLTRVSFGVAQNWYGHWINH